MNFYEFMKSNKDRYIKYEPEFKATFGISMWPYMDMVTGFDVVKFDEEFIKPGDNESTNAAIVHKYGREAANLIMKLI